jgi:hypothetical protein
MNILKLLFLVVIFSFTTIKAFSQSLDSPIKPVEQVIPDWEIGGFVGIGSNYNSGTYVAECPDCLFDDASKFGFTIGAKMDYEILRWFYFGVNLLYDNQNVDGSFQRIEQILLTRTDNSTMYVPIEFRQTMNLKVSSLGIVPNAVFRIDDWLDIRLGFYYDFLFGTNITHTKELITKSVVLPDGEKVNVTIPNSKDNSVILENHEIPGINSSQYGLFPQINLNIPLSKDNDLIIGSFMKIPLATISSSQNDFKINTWRIFFGLSFDLNDDDSYRAKLEKNKHK